MSKQKSFEGASAKDKKAFASYLSEDEELVLAAGFGKNYIRHKYIYFILWPGGIFFILPLIYCYFTQTNIGYGMLMGLGLAMVAALVMAIWHYNSHRYLLTTRRVILKNGLFNVKLVSALYDKITNLEVEQSFMDRIIMKHGSIIINTAGGVKEGIRLEYLDNPIEFKNLLERLINRERERFGGGTGPVVTLEGEVVD